MKTILVIDDDPALRNATMVALHRNGYEVEGAGDGAEGLALAFARPPSLVLSDVNMAGANGFAVLQELRSRPQTAGIPVIIMTGETHKVDARFSMEKGADDYLQKPFRVEQLLAAVGARLERYEAAEVKNRSERADTEEKLKLLTSALEAAANGIVITERTGHIVWVNQAFTRLTGYAASEVTGKTPAVLNSGCQNREFFAGMWNTILAGQVWQGELINRRKDGSHYYEGMTITPVRNTAGDIQNFIAIKQDISDRKKVEHALAAERDLLQSLMDNLPDYIYFKDAESRFTRINQALARHLGLPGPDEAIGKSDADFFSLREARQKLVDERRLLITGEPILGLMEEQECAGKKTWVLSTKVPLRDAAGEITGLVGISRDVTAHKLAELERLAMQSRYQVLFESASEAIMTMSDGIFLDCNPATLRMFHCADKAQFITSSVSDFSPPGQPDGTPSPTAAERHITEALKLGAKRYEWTHRRRDGEDFPAEVSLTAFWLGDCRVVQATVRDLTAQKKVEKEKQLMDMHLRQSQKLESIGQLAAGIAHEINTPTQYVGDNTRFLKDAFNGIFSVLRNQEKLLAAAKQSALTPESFAQNDALIIASDLEYLCKQVPQAISETLEGIDRVSKIVGAMKEFSHPGGREKSLADLNQAIVSTVTVARNEWKYVADLTTSLEPNLPLIPCFLGEFNQVILNLVVNAAHAIEDVIKKQPGTKGRITIHTRRDGDQVEVRVSDTGTGIPAAHRQKVFEPFFTTKGVGKGTGQGLSIVYSNIVKRHGGTVSFETETDRGTTFIIRLPVHPQMPVELPAPSKPEGDA
jgi:two-component system NtrC family sensor kinase